MNTGEISAWHQATREPVRLRWSQGKISALEAAPVRPPRHLWLAPPLVDLQINGFAGFDFQQDNPKVAALQKATRQLRASGCTRFLLTLVTDAWPRLLARLKQLRKLRARSPVLQRAIAGWHIEGPFLSAEPGFCGAHDPALMRDPTPEDMRELRGLAGDDLLLATLAPERLNAIAAIHEAVSLGIRISLGHTNAPTMRLEQAIKYGATGFTHLANGCPQSLDRHDNILWRVLETRGLKVSLIPDQIHVAPSLFRLIHRVLGAEMIYYTTDAMSAAGAPPGRYKLGPLQLEVGEDRVVRQPGKSNFAGSALTPIQGIFRAAEMLDCAWQEVWPRFSDAPARFMGLEHGLRVGGPADFCLLKVSEPNRFESMKVFVRGEAGVE